MTRATRSHPLRTTLAALTTFLLASACGGSETPSGPTVDVDGRYALVSVDGAPLPFPIVLDGQQLVEITFENLDLAEDGVYDHVVGTRTTRGTTVTNDTRRLFGVYDVSRTTVTLTRSPDGALAIMTYAGGELTLVSGGFTFLYRRR